MRLWYTLAANWKIDHDADSTKHNNPFIIVNRILAVERIDLNVDNKNKAHFYEKLRGEGDLSFNLLTHLTRLQTTSPFTLLELTKLSLSHNITLNGISWTLIALYKRRQLNVVPNWRKLTTEVSIQIDNGKLHLMSRCGMNFTRELTNSRGDSLQLHRFHLLPQYIYRCNTTIVT